MEISSPVVLAVLSVILIATMFLKKPKTNNVTVALDSKKPNESKTIRHKDAAVDLLDSPDSGVKTVYDCMQYACQKYPDLKTFGERKLMKLHVEEKEVKKMVNGNEVKEMKKWNYYELSNYKWKSIKEIRLTCEKIGSALVHFGFKQGEKLCLFASTSADWQMFAHGCFSQAMSIVTAYDTLGVDGLLYSLNETESVGLFCNADLLPTVAKLGTKCQTLKVVVYSGDATSEHLELVKTSIPSLKILSLSEMIQLGGEHAVKPNPPKPDDLCCIMYTSGSTGNPKGVILTHANLVATIAGFHSHLGDLTAGAEDIYIAYLPLAHILEFIVETFLLTYGVRIGYGNPKTLTDTSCRNCLGDIKELKPTLMAGVPSVWDLITKGILAKVNSQSPIVKALFFGALNFKKMCVKWGIPLGGLADAIVFKKVREQVGGRLRFSLSGGAPLSAETQTFISMVVCPLFQAYGMTETVGCGTILSPTIGWQVRNVGSPPSCVEMKLVDVPDAKYFTNTTPPQGEILFRGNNITSGYFKQPALTEELFTEDGWLQTGDIGQINPDGTLTIIDRKKNLVKLSHGEYVALEKCESIYATAVPVQRVCVYGDSERSFLIAIVVPVPHTIEKIASELGIHGENWEMLCHNDKIKSAVLANLVSVGKGKLASAEIVKGIVLADEEWTPKNGFLTRKFYRFTVVVCPHSTFVLLI